MVLVIGGYELSWQDAKAWALRHWPDIDIYDERKLAFIVQHHQRLLGGNMTCIPYSPGDSEGLVFIIVIYSKRDPSSTLHKYMKFTEGRLALKCKELLFSHEGDKGFAERIKFVTIADPWKDSPSFRRQSAPMSSEDEDSDTGEQEEVA